MFSQLSRSATRILFFFPSLSRDPEQEKDDVPVLGTASSFHGGKSVDGIAGANSDLISTELSQVTEELPRPVFRAITTHNPLLTIESIDVSRKNQKLVFI